MDYHELSWAGTQTGTACVSRLTGRRTDLTLRTPVSFIFNPILPQRRRDFHLKGAELRRQGINRIGNLLVPNDNYCRFEDWVNPILHAMADEQVGE